MLQELRRGVSNLLAKALLALLVVAFVGWGVADVFRTAGQGSVAQIGKTEIGVAEFQQAYQDDLAQMSQQFGRRLTPDQARMLGVEGRTISRLIGSAAIDAHVRELNLALSDDTIAAQLRNDPALKGPDGKFNRVAFDAYLRQNGLSEARFLAMQRRESLRDQVTDSLLADVTPPKTMIDTIHRYREETRRIEFVTRLRHDARLYALPSQQRREHQRGPLPQ